MLKYSLAKDKFCKTLKDVSDKISGTNKIFLIEGYSTRMGKEEDSQIVGRFREEEINNNGER
jgi:hypothetical protein